MKTKNFHNDLIYTKTKHIKSTKIQNLKHLFTDAENMAGWSVRHRNVLKDGPRTDVFHLLLFSIPETLSLFNPAL